MTQFILFTTKTAAHVAPAQRQATRELTARGYKVLVWDSITLQHEPDAGSARALRATTNSYYIEISPSVYYLSALAPDDEYFMKAINGCSDVVLKGIIDDARAILADIDGYTARKAAEIEAAKQARAEAEKVAAEESQKRWAADYKARAARKESDLAAFRSGRAIPWGSFEDLCEDHGVKMPIQTIGAGRKSVKNISALSMTVCGKSRPTLALEAARKLHAIAMADWN